MDHNFVNKILKLLRDNTQDTFARECLYRIDFGTVSVKRPNLLSRQHLIVVNSVRSKVANASVFGLTELVSALNKYNEIEVCITQVTCELEVFLIYTSSNFDFLIGLIKSTKLNTKKNNLTALANSKYYRPQDEILLINGNVIE